MGAGQTLIDTSKVDWEIDGGLEFELTSLLDFDITLVWDRIQDPRENSDGTFTEQDDFRLTFGPGFDF